MLTIKKIIAAALSLALAFSVCGCEKREEVKDTILGKSDSSETQTVKATGDYNALTGEKLTDSSQANSRPIAVMINNAKAALPQSGLTDADIIYEMETEGGVTRLMAVYNDISEITGRVGPVRSARDQFIEFVLPLDAIYVHIGTSTTAKRMLNFYSYQDIDGIYLGFLSFSFDNDLAKTRRSEHCWFTDASLIEAGIGADSISTQSDGFYPAFNFVGYNDAKYVIADDEGGSAANIAYAYSDYRDVSFAYDEASGKYLKYAFGVPHVDADTNEQLAFENVIVLLCEVGIEEDNGILPEFSLDEGEGLYFTGGRYQKITWTKDEPEDPLVIRDENGDILDINVGKTYVGVLRNERAEGIALTDTDGNITQPFAAAEKQ